MYQQNYLDITPRIIAMGFPSSDVEGLYRNPISEVYSDNKKQINLSSKWIVSKYPFQDHNAPPVQTIVDCCRDIHEWLSRSEDNVVGINCKAGKGRTGLIICCYLMHSGLFSISEQAMSFYAGRRTKDGKGVTIPSQQRYVRYYEIVLNQYHGQAPISLLLELTKIRVDSIPNFAGDFLVMLISQGCLLTTTEPLPILKKATYFEIPVNFPVSGDIKVQLACKKGRIIQKICHLWFSTAFISDSVLVLNKNEIDVANKDRKNIHFKPDFSINIFFEPILHISHHEAYLKKYQQQRDSQSVSINNENREEIEPNKTALSSVNNKNGALDSIQLGSNRIAKITENKQIELDENLDTNQPHLDDRTDESKMNSFQQKGEDIDAEEEQEEVECLKGMQVVLANEDMNGEEDSDNLVNHRNRGDSFYGYYESSSDEQEEMIPECSLLSNEELLVENEGKLDSSNPIVTVKKRTQQWVQQHISEQIHPSLSLLGIERVRQINQSNLYMEVSPGILSTSTPALRRTKSKINLLTTSNSRSSSTSASLISPTCSIHDLVLSKLEDSIPKWKETKKSKALICSLSSKSETLMGSTIQTLKTPSDLDTTFQK